MGVLSLLRQYLKRSTIDVMFNIFNFFKKKRSPIDSIFASLDERSIKILGGIAKALFIQLIVFRNYPNYKTELQSIFVRGYLFGYFDAATQKFGLPHTNQNEAISRIIFGHHFLLEDQKIDAIYYIKSSIALQDNEIYQDAHQKGVDDLFKSFESDERWNSHLVQYFSRTKNHN